jgi:hypothetical protein
MASMGFAWWIGLAIAPTLGTQLLIRSPTAAFLTAAAVATAAAASTLTLGRRLPGLSIDAPPAPQHHALRSGFGDVMTGAGVIDPDPHGPIGARILEDFVRLPPAGPWPIRLPAAADEEAGHAEGDKHHDDQYVYTSMHVSALRDQVSCGLAASRTAVP